MQLIDLFVPKDKDSESYVRHYMTHLKPGWAFELWRVGQLDQRLHHKIEMCVLSEGQLQAPKHGEWFMSLFGEVLAAPPSTPTPPPPLNFLQCRATFLSVVPAATCRLQNSLTTAGSDALHCEKWSVCKKAHCVGAALCCAAVLLHCLVYWFNG